MQKYNGLVIAYFGSSVAVETEDGQVFQCHLRRNQELPVVGDQVTCQRDADDTGTIIAIAKRRSLLSRGDARGKVKPIAANVDAIFVVMSPPPIFSNYLVDRYLVAATLLNIQPVLVLNKADLLTEEARKSVLASLQPYQQITYPVILSSIITHEGLVTIADFLVDKTAVLVGPSGVGKSSIIAALGGNEAIRVGEVSAKGAGKHTTTATRLYHLPQGGHFIDSPGVREFNLWQIDQQEVLRGFPEMMAIKSPCKFRDCKHLAEPGCAIKLAVSEATISANRYESYQLLMRDATKH